MISAERLKELKADVHRAMSLTSTPGEFSPDVSLKPDIALELITQLERAQGLVEALEILAKPCAQSEYATANCDCMCVRDCGNTAREALNVWRGETNG